jgi:hypothetical protein
LAAGSSGQVLTSTGLGTLTWATASSGIPYTGATGAVDLGAYDLTLNGMTVGKGAGGIFTNTAVGASALSSNTTGYNNTANGKNALYSNTTGVYNTAIGSYALNKNTTGLQNTAYGFNALYANTTGYANTAIGSNALERNTTGKENTANGAYALLRNTTGRGNTANGFSALFDNDTGDNNTAYGLSALTSNITGSNNTAIGYNANVASYNLENATAIGNGASVNASNKIQLGNGDVTAVQLGTGTKVTLETGFLKITGGTLSAGKVLTSDADGLAIWATPSSSGVDLTTAQTIAGVKTFLSAPVLSSTTASKALFTDANKNIVSNEITGSGNVVMSTSPLLVTPNLGTPSAAILTNATGLPLTNGAGVTGILPVSKGGTGSDIKNFVDLTTAGQVISAEKIFDADLFVGYYYGVAQRRLFVNGPVYATGFLNSSDKRLKSNIQNSNLGLDFINKLRPVSYYRNNDESKKTEYGLIAQELEETLNSAGVTNNGIISKDGEGMYSVRYNDLIAPMIKAIQEQKTIIDNQQIQIGNQQLRIDELKKMVESMLKK